MQWSAIQSLELYAPKYYATTTRESSISKSIGDSPGENQIVCDFDQFILRKILIPFRHVIKTNFWPMCSHLMHLRFNDLYYYYIHTQINSLLIK